MLLKAMLKCDISNKMWIFFWKTQLCRFWLFVMFLYIFFLLSQVTFLYISLFACPGWSHVEWFDRKTSLFQNNDFWEKINGNNRIFLINNSAGSSNFDLIENSSWIELDFWVYGYIGVKSKPSFNAFFDVIPEAYLLFCYS